MAYSLLSQILFAILGSAICLQLLWLLRYDTGRRAERRSGWLLASVTFTLYATTLISAILLFAGQAKESLLYLVPCNLSFMAAAFMPTVVFHSWRQSSSQRESAKGFQALLKFSIAGATLLSILLWLWPGTGLNSDGLHAGIGFYDLTVLLVGFALFRSTALTEQMLLCLKITRAAAIAGIASLFLAIAMRHHQLLCISLLVIEQFSLLIAVLASFIFFTRFRYADVFATRSVRSLGLGFLSVAAMMVVRSLAAAFQWGVLGHLLVATAIAGFVALAVWGAPRVDTWVNRRLLQQPDWEAALETMVSRMQTMQSSHQLVQWVDTRLSATLSIASVRTVPAASLQEKVLALVRPFGDILETNRDAPGTGSDSEVLVPVMIDNALRFLISVTLGPGRHTLLSSEIQFLRAVAHHLSTQVRRVETEEENRLRDVRNSLLKSQVTEAELRALRAQINPHFLFNSLNTIAELIATNPPQAERMTLHLSKVFRHVLRQSDQQMVSVREEFEFLRSYLQIEEERFGDRLRVTFELDPGAAETSLPTLLLQPLIENALKYGIAPRKHGGSVLITASRYLDTIRIQVKDSGLGDPKSVSGWAGAVAQHFGFYRRRT